MQLEVEIEIPAQTRMATIIIEEDGGGELSETRLQLEAYRMVQTLLRSIEPSKHIFRLDGKIVDVRLL